MLDEPTNNLDVETLRALEEALLEFPGTALVISHDGWFLDRVATHILAYEGEGKVVFFEGNYTATDSQDAGRKYRGRKLSDGGVMARFYQAVSEARVAHIIKIDLTADTFNYVLDTRALERARMLDGKWLTNVPAEEFTPEQVVARYKSLSDIEQGFRVLKSEIEIAPVYHRLPDRIRAHALIYFLARVLYRVLRMRLKARDHRLSPQRALEIARRTQYHQVTLHRQQTASVLSKLTPEQHDLFEAIDLPKPSAKRL